MPAPNGKPTGGMGLPMNPAGMYPPGSLNPRSGGSGGSQIADADQLPPMPDPFGDALRAQEAAAAQEEAERVARGAPPPGPPEKALAKVRRIRLEAEESGAGGTLPALVRKLEALDEAELTFEGPPRYLEARAHVLRVLCELFEIDHKELCRQKRDEEIAAMPVIPEALVPEGGGGA